MQATDPTVEAARATHADALKAKQNVERHGHPSQVIRPTAKTAKAAKAPKVAAVPTPDPRVAVLTSWREANLKAPAEVLAVVDAAVARGSKAPRQTVEKADPGEVAKFFASTGLNRKQIASAVGVSTSVIATVQNPTGDRWSRTRFEAAKPLILAAAKSMPKAAPAPKAAES